MKIFSLIAFVALVASGEAKDCQAKKSNQKLFCYYGRAEDVNSCKCTHIILPANTDSKVINSLQDKLTDAKILLTVKEFNEDLVKVLENSKIDGLEINLSKLDSKTDLPDFISTVKTKLGEKLYIAVSVPVKTELVAKYYDFKTLAKTADVLILQTHFLGTSRNVTFHPSRLSGLWDVQNTDSVVDLVSGLGAPLSKLVISSPVQAFKFTLQNENFTAPGSPALELSTLTRNELCKHMKSNEWTLERDEDQAGPYIFRDKNWIAFEDSTSIDIKAKYARIRGLAGLALKDLSQDGGEDCGETILESAFSGLSKQARAPRGAVLHSLEREILENPTRPFDNIQVSPYRITRVIDVEGNVNAIRQDTRTEFECSRQGYFVHPRSCGRFYRCVKFDQLSDEFSVFEFDCPAGLAFDERVEVCVWPGSLPHASACSGSSEIAPVPKNRFVCPGEPGYYADVENCRWFFACLDHGKSPLSAYEFRCPFSLVFDEDRLVCEWPWLVPKCGSGFGFGGDYAYKQEARSDIFGLDLYDGLGTLSGIQLGGLAGKLEQPIAKTYSTISQAKGRSNNFGNELYSSNDQYESNAASLVNTNNYHDNVQRFEYESQKSQEIDLQNYLANQNLNHQYQHGHGQNFEAHSGNYDANGHLYNIQNGDQSSYINNNHESGASYAHTSQLNTHQEYPAVQSSYINQNNYNHGSGNSYVHASQVDSNQEHIADQSSYINQNNYNHGSKNYVHTSQINTNQGHNVDQSYIHHNQGSLENAGVQSFTNLNNYNQGGATSYAHTSQVNSHHDNVKIFSGEHSGVSSGLAGQNVEISQHGLNLGSYDTVTPVNLVSSTAIPTVTSLPISSSTLNLDVYHGGVLAKLPNLEHKLEHPSTINDQLANLTFYASTTPVPDFAGYEYQKPSINFEENHVTGSYLPPKTKQVTYNTYVKPLAPVGGLKSAVFENKFVKTELKPIQPAFMSTYTYSQPSYYQQYNNLRNKGRVYYNSKPNYIQSSMKEEGYYYGKPYINLQQSPVHTYSYQKPLVVEHNYSPAKAVNYQNYHYEQPKVVQQSEGYVYNKPAVGFIEQPKSVTQYAEVNHNAEGYVYQKPKVAFVEGPKIIQQTNLQGGYVYEKPSVSFVEQPKLVTQHSQISHHNQNGGYIYEKPKVSFIEEPKVVHHQTITKEVQNTGYVYEKPSVTFVEQPKLITQHSQINHETQNSGYIYDKPKVAFVEGPKVEQEGYIYNKPAVTFIEQPKKVGYVYEKPAIQFEENPAVSHQVIHHHEKPKIEIKEGYVYNKPAVSFVEEPKVYVKPSEPKVVQNVYHHAEHKGYEYTKPSVTFIEQPQNQGYVYEKPSVTFIEQPKVVHKTEGYVYNKPVVQFKEEPKVVEQSNYLYQKPVVNLYQQTELKGYAYDKPAISFIEQPKPKQTYTYQKPVNYVQPLTSIQETHQVHHVQPIKQETVYQQYAPISHNYNSGYHYEKPAVVFKEQAKYVAPTTPTPIIHQYIQEAPKPVVYSQVQQSIKPTYQQVITQPQIISSFSINQDTQKQGYYYNKPSVVFEEKPVQIYNPPPTIKTVQTYLPPVKKVETYLPPVKTELYLPPVKTVETYLPPVKTVETYLPPVKKVQSYLPPAQPTQIYLPAPTPTVNIEEVYEEPIVPKKAYVTGNTGYQYPKPEIRFGERLVYSTPKPTYPSTAASIVAKIEEAPLHEYKFYSYDNRNQDYGRVSTAAPIEVSNQEYVKQSRPIARYEFSSLSEKVENQPIIEEPIRTYIPVLKTPAPTYIPAKTFEPIYVPEATPAPTYIPVRTPASRYVPVENTKVRVKTHSRPIVRYEFSSLDSQYNQNAPPTQDYVKVTPASTYLPVTRVSKRPVKTNAGYLPPISSTTTTERYFEVTNPSREYLPVTQEIYRIKTRVSTTERPVSSTRKINREYLPVTTQATRVRKPSREYLPVVSTEKTSKQVENYEADTVFVSTRRPKVVKVLKSKTIVKNNDFHPLLSAKLGAQCTCVSNTLNLRRKPQNNERNEETYETEDNYEDDRSEQINIVTKKPVIVSIEPVTEVVEVFRKKSKRPSVRIIEEEEEENEDNLKLVKSAVREGVREGIKQALATKDFDRYGPGGFRSRSETLQGTVDCQRAGLFRHPTQCNKFYSCRWDCVKKKFTLHVFNCPVHLTFDSNLGACNWPSQGPACVDNTLLPSD